MPDLKSAIETLGIDHVKGLIENNKIDLTIGDINPTPGIHNNIRREFMAKQLREYNSTLAK